MLFEQAARLVRNLAGVTIRVSLHTRIFVDCKIKCNR